MRYRFLFIITMMMAGALWPMLSLAEFIEVKGFQYEVDKERKEATVHRYVGKSKSVVIPKSIKHEGVEYPVTGINNRAFRDSQMQKRIRKIIIGDAVRSIDDNTFEGCSDMASVTIGKSVSTIGYSAFSGCSSLVRIEIPCSVASIGRFAFYECLSLESIVIGENVAHIGDWSFAHCNKLKTITCRGAVVPKVDQDTFKYLNTKVITLVVPNSAVEEYRKAVGWGKFGLIIDI